MLMRALFTALLTTALVACGGSSSSDDTSNTVQSTGTVVDEQGVPLAGARVTVVSASTVTGTSQTVDTNSSGQFALTLDAATALVLKVQKTGYASSFRAAAASVDNASAASRVVLLPVASTQTFDPTQAAVLRVPGTPARVELPASSLVREDGQAISGTTSVTLTPIDPSADIARMPGLLVDGASGEPIESLGALTVNFTDTTGAPLNLASGKTATIRIPATPAAGATLPATFPLYHLNETTGRWTQEGTATLQTDPATGAKYYEGTVSHFSTWNADKVITRTSLDVGTTLQGVACSVPPGLRVQALGVDYNGVSDASGNNVFVRENSQVRLRLLDEVGGVIDELELRSGPAGAAVRLPRCLNVPPLVTLSGRVTVSSGQLSGYQVQISGPSMQTIVVPISSDGAYSTRVYANRGEVRARLVGADRGTPETRVTTTVAAVDASFTNLTVQDTRFVLDGCVQGWASYRQTSVQVSLFRGATPMGAPQTLQSTGPNFRLDGVPFNSTLTLRLTAPDPTLAEKTTTLVVGSTPITLGSCLNLPLAATADLQVRGSGLTRSFDAGGSTAGDAPITAYAWDFGDGSTASGATANRAFAATGSYVVSLRVTDALGQVSLVRRTVDVTAGGTLSTLTPARALDAGSNHTCAVRADGVWCWGSNFYAQLGSERTTVIDGDNVIESGVISSGVPLRITGLSNMTAVTAGEQHSCALSASGTVQCWGSGKYGQLGQGSRVDSATPVPVSGLTTAVAVSAGGFSTCALLQSGSVSCWGNSNTSIDNLVPAPVAGLSGVTALSAGGGHHCAVLSDGSVRCWGNNDDGQLGNGSTTDSVSPVVVSGISSAVSVVAGDRHSCALLADGTLRCWGYRGILGLTVGSSVLFGRMVGSSALSGLMGDGGTGFAPALTPVTVSGISTAVAISAGSRHNCALLADATVWCWGGAASARGQSVATDVAALAPVQVAMNGAVNALALGDGFTCVSLAAGGVQCLGVGSQGQLGTGGQSNQLNPSPSPFPDASLTPLNVLFP
jgi:alpha-tubulin suppressor-like RCC1 family protein